MTLTASDIIEIHQLVARYNLSLDSGNGEEYANTFVSNGVLEANGKVVTGRGALAEYAVQFAARTNNIARHVTSNVLLDGEGDDASLAAYAHMSLAETAGPRLVATGTYDDRLRREDGQWRFVQRCFQLG